MKTMEKVTISALQQMKRDAKKIVGVVAWDYQIAQIADRAGVDLISVGDSVGVNLWGHATDTEVTVDEMLICCKAVRRDLRDLVVPGDDSDDLSPFALHFLERGNRYLGFHLYLRSAGEPPDRRDDRARIGAVLPGDVERAAVCDRGE